MQRRPGHRCQDKTLYGRVAQSVENMLRKEAASEAVVSARCPTPLDFPSRRRSPVEGTCVRRHETVTVPSMSTRGAPGRDSVLMSRACSFKQAKEAETALLRCPSVLQVIPGQALQVSEVEAFGPARPRETHLLETEMTQPLLKLRTDTTCSSCIFIT